MTNAAGRLAELPGTILVSQAQAGSAEALDILLCRHRKVLLKRARSHCGDCAWVEDLSQETCLKLSSHLQDLREPEAFAGWAQSVLVNTAWHCREKNCEKICTALEATDYYQIEGLSVESAYGADTDGQCLWNLLWKQARNEGGRRGQVAVLMLAYFARHECFPSVRDIARALRISNPTAQSDRVATLLTWRRRLRAAGLYP